MIRTLLTDSAAEHLNEGVRRIALCLNQLSHEEVWHDHNGNLASVGNLILHLRGNVSQYILRGIGGEAIERHRDEEFGSKPDLSSDELLGAITETVEKATAVITEMSDDDLERRILIQGFDHTGASIVVHVVEHFSYHVGQITFAVKMLRDVDLGYYAGQNLNRQ